MKIDRKMIGNWGKRWGVSLIRVYFTYIFIWFLIYVFFHESVGLVAFFSEIALYLFFPLPLVVASAFALRRREIWFGLVACVLIFLWFWGPLFMPSMSQEIESEGKLRVMTYNPLGFISDVGRAIRVIKAVDADIVLIQELNTTLSAELEKELIQDYPYQMLDPLNGVTGMGTISKYPVELTGTALKGLWVGAPQVLMVDWDGIKIKMVNFHMRAGGFGSNKSLTTFYGIHRENAEELDRIADKEKLPLIVGGDANTTHLMKSYEILTKNLADVWWQAGWGFGHTFPGSDAPGSSRPHIGSWYAPQWLVRIDYIFTSDHWRTVNVFLAPFDGQSDHRGVVADLVLLGDNIK
jgi:endonuclease/exonuclease/phosphatase (EEP) superfamily protein YafD